MLAVTRSPTIGPCRCQRQHSHLTAARRNNTSDEYSIVVNRYGKPDSILSTEHDTPSPKVATRIGDYHAAHVKIIFVPNGCVTALEETLRILDEQAQYPAIAEGEMKKIEACVPNAGWTIVGYIDSSNNKAATTELVSSRLGNPQKAATALAAQEAGNKAERQKTEEAYRKAMARPVDPNDSRVIEQRKQAETGLGGSDAEQLRHGCEVTNLLYEDKRVSDLSLKELQMLRLCRTLGY